MSDQAPQIKVGDTLYYNEPYNVTNTATVVDIINDGEYALVQHNVEDLPKYGLAIDGLCGIRQYYITEADAKEGIERVDIFNDLEDYFRCIEDCPLNVAQLRSIYKIVYEI